MAQLQKTALVKMGNYGIDIGQKRTDQQNLIYASVPQHRKCLCGSNEEMINQRRRILLEWIITSVNQQTAAA